MADGFRPFSERRDYIELWQYLLQDQMGYDVAPEYVLRDILGNPPNASLFMYHGFPIPDMLLKCDNCGTIYDQDWVPLTGPNGKHERAYGLSGEDIEVDFYYPRKGGKLEHIRKTIEISGGECEECWSKHESIQRGSVRMLIEDPMGWVRHRLYRQAYSKKTQDVNYVPLRKRLPAPDKA